MALTATEEAQARQLIAQQAALLSLAGNEATITSKLGATKVNLGQLPAASEFADADLLLVRQGGIDKGIAGSVAKSSLGAGKANSGANADITSMTAVTSIGATGGTAVKGTNTNDDAAAGYVGEYMSASRAAASALALTTATAAVVASRSLTAGDWDVWGQVGYITASSSTSVIRLNAETTAGTGFSGSDGDGVAALVYPGGAALNSGGNGSVVINTGVRRFSLAATTTVNLLAYADFTVAGLSAFGMIKARRRR